MKKIKQNIKPKEYENSISEKYSNYKWMLYIGMGGLLLMFFDLTFMFAMSRTYYTEAPIKLPLVFYWNTLILLFSSIILEFVKKYYRTDDYSKYKTALIFLPAMGILFLLGQVGGWAVLFTSGYQPTNHYAAYLYVISAIHALHIIGCLVFLFYFINKSFKVLTNYATSIVYFTDPVIKSQLKLFSILWHFLGAMWLYLMLFFLLMK
ncbi:MAG TPA: hypothetical protein PKM51_00040 [Chitinophagales bacterium]|nr:hypothetical protein [Chitinophagales bacterium]